ncbi:hypothetical protein DGM85_16385 [Xanthomonas phaseoli pv. phaseoli]|nr:hypothetical protein DGM93_06305 [Xanthomonas phaseoli pv. phaseoli]QWN29840.1 hypothetical protein DGM85_16385 [Xanthomonas phaseoli pv. phaseoli]QWN35143.1 hypothetical protein DGM81_06330 [Xanthomonas phaseoli pv. phaseoli]
MSSKRYTDEFKIEAVRQVTDRGFKVADVAERLGVTVIPPPISRRQKWNFLVSFLEEVP